MDSQNKKIKVLIAEDDVFILEMYSVKLSSEGFEVLTAGNGEEALKKIEEEKPDVVLLDLLMPKMDGWGVLSGLKKHNNKEKKPVVIVLTNLGEKSNIEKALSMGADDYLIKSFFTPEEIVSKMKKIIEK
jgi:DNA-binding response OmpR family regulator